MRQSLRFIVEEGGDLLLLASVLTVVPSWVGGVELLSAFGLDGVTAGLLSGTYAVGRGALSGAALFQHARRGTLDLGGGWLAARLRAVSRRAPLADRYPTATTTQFTAASEPYPA